MSLVKGTDRITSPSIPELQTTLTTTTPHSALQNPSVLHHKPLGDKLDHSRSNTPSPLNLSSASSKTPTLALIHPQLHLRGPAGWTSWPLVAKAHEGAKHILTVKSRTKLNSTPTDHNHIVTPREQCRRAAQLGLSVQEGIWQPQCKQQSGQKLEPHVWSEPFAAKPMYTSLPPQSAFPPPTFMPQMQASLPGLRPYPSLDQISFLPHMAYTYAAGAASFAEMQQRRKYQRKPGFQVNNRHSVS